MQAACEEFFLIFITILAMFVYNSYLVLFPFRGLSAVRNLQRQEKATREKLPGQHPQQVRRGNRHLVYIFKTPLCLVFICYLCSSFLADLSHLDSQPGTPMSVESANSEASKLRLKIKVHVVSSPQTQLSPGSTH